MGEMSFDFPPDLRRLIEARVEEGHYADPAAFVRDLIRRADEAEAFEADQQRAGETPEYVAWVREKIEEGLAAGGPDVDAFEFLVKLKAGKHDGAG